MQQAPGLIADGLADSRVGVTEPTDSDAAQGIEVAVAILVKQVSTLAMLKADGQWLVGVHQVFGHQAPQKQKAPSRKPPYQNK
jgi:hypothetical protein